MSNASQCVPGCRCLLCRIADSVLPETDDYMRPQAQKTQLRRRHPFCPHTTVQAMHTKNGERLSYMCSSCQAEFRLVSKDDGRVAHILATIRHELECSEEERQLMSGLGAEHAAMSLSMATNCASISELNAFTVLGLKTLKTLNRCDELATQRAALRQKREALEKESKS